MSYGWYLLDDKQKELIRSHLVREVLPYGPRHVDVRVGAGSIAPGDHRFREVLDELVSMNLRAVSIDVETGLDAPQVLIERIRSISASRTAIASIELDAGQLTADVAHAVLEAEVHALTLRLDATGERFSDDDIERVRYLRDERNRRGWHFPKLVCHFALGSNAPDDLKSFVALGRELQAGQVAFHVTTTAGAGKESEWRSGVKADVDAGFVAVHSDIWQSVDTPVDAPSEARSMTAFLPWFHFAIDADLSVWPCRHVIASTSRSLGHLEGETVSEVWNGERFRSRRRAAVGRFLARPDGEANEPLCSSCTRVFGLPDNAFLSETEKWLARMRATMSAPYFPKVATDDGFNHPALRAMRARFPRSQFPAGEMNTVERIHAEAEIARIEALRLRVRAAELDAEASMLRRSSPTPDEPERLRLRAAAMKRIVAELDAFAERLFEEAGRVGGIELVTSAPPPFVSMRTWLERLAAVDLSVSAEVDETRVIWMSLFKTLAENADMSKIHRVMGVGVGFDGPEVNYNDHFAEHYCLDIVDYSDRNPNLTFITANIETGVDFPDAHFDLIYSHSVFEHLKDVGAALREVDRLVALGKYVYITISPLYFSHAGAHVNHPVKLENWEHLDPASRYYLLDSPDPSRIDEGVYLNKVTVSEFLAEVGKVGWEIRHFSMRIVHPRDIPAELSERHPMVDLAVEEFRFVGRKVIPKAKGIEW